MELTIESNGDRRLLQVGHLQDAGDEKYPGPNNCSNSTTQQQQQQCRRDWSGLAGDVLRLVIHHLPIVDRIAVSRVCAPWRRVALSVRPHNKLRYGLPCLLYMHSTTTGDVSAAPTYRLVDPVHRDNKHASKGFPEGAARLLSSRDGWLLFMSWPVFPAEHQDQRPYTYHCDIYFVNPFSKTRIRLPTLRTIQICGQYSVSDRPTSPSCVVLALLDVLFDFVEIAFCRPGDAQWTIFERECNVRVFGCLTDPTWCAGSFWCLDRRGNLMAFDPSRRSWTVLRKQDDLGDGINKRLEQYLVESAGDLLRVCDMGSSVVAMFRFDAPTGRWVPVADLGDRALFLGRQESISVVAPVGSSMRGRVYFNRVRGEDDDVVVVSCSLRGSSEVDGDAAAAERVAAPSSALGKIRDFLFSSWVDLEWCKATSQELEWRSIVFGDD